MMVLEKQYSILDQIFPDAKAIFSNKPKSIQEIKDSCVVVLDTNVLLVPYTIGKDSLEQIQKTYSLLIGQKRLFLPSQVVKEFAKNRPQKITELFQKLSRKRDGIKNFQEGKYPLLDSLPEYHEVLRIEQEIDKLLRDYRSSIGELTNRIRTWNWNDPVSVMYSNLFHEQMIKYPEIDKDEFMEDLKFRNEKNVPPGYKDSGKEDGGVGDLLVWYTILQLGRDQASDVIFVSGDVKADWWHRSEKQQLFPRFELIDEFRRFTNDKTLHILELSDLLAIYGADQKVVNEIRNEELQQKLETSFSERLSFAEDAVHRWLIQRYPASEVNTSVYRGFDFLVTHPEGESIGVEVKGISGFDKNIIKRIVANQIASGVTEKVMVIFVCENKSKAIDFDQNLKRNFAFSNADILSGYIENGDFICIDRPDEILMFDAIKKMLPIDGSNIRAYLHEVSRELGRNISVSELEDMLDQLTSERWLLKQNTPFGVRYVLNNF